MPELSCCPEVPEGARPPLWDDSLRATPPPAKNKGLRHNILHSSPLSIPRQPQFAALPTVEAQRLLPGQPLACCCGAGSSSQPDHKHVRVGSGRSRSNNLCMSGKLGLLSVRPAQSNAVVLPPHCSRGEPPAAVAKVALRLLIIPPHFLLGFVPPLLRRRANSKTSSRA